MEQLNSAFSESVEIETIPVILEWPKIIKGIINIKSNGLLMGNESMIIDDFLDLVPTNFPNVNPVYACIKPEGLHEEISVLDDLMK